MIEKFKQWLVELLTDTSEIAMLQRQLTASEEEVEHYRSEANNTYEKWKEEVTKLKNEIEELKTGKFKGHNDAVAVDFQNPSMVFFSIERIWEDDANFPVTVIGYQDNQGNAHDWYLHVSEEKHKTLVLEFQTSLSTKRMKGK